MTNVERDTRVFLFNKFILIKHHAVYSFLYIRFLVVTCHAHISYINRYFVVIGKNSLAFAEFAVVLKTA